MRRGEIRWYTFRLPDKRRPVLILTRAELVDRIAEFIVVPRALLKACGFAESVAG